MMVETYDNQKIVQEITQKIRNLKSLSQLKMDEMIKYAEDLAKSFVDLGITSSQLRKFHGYFIKIWSKYSANKPKYKNDEHKFKEEILSEIIFVKTYLAYQTARDKKLGPFRNVLDLAIDKINDQKDFEMFRKFYDAIIAYFRYYEQNKGKQFSKGGFRG